MRILLDSHVFIWVVTGQQHRLSPAQRDYYSGGANELYLSVASIWEMLIKSALGKLTFKAPAAQFIQSQMGTNRIQPLAIHFTHLTELEFLPPIHKDPFDRMLIAQSRAEKMPILSSDSTFRQYDVAIL
jgi:PIN domain nuclease of toxin-antitoxin system